MHPKLHLVDGGALFVVQFGDAITICSRDNSYADRITLKSAGDRTLGVGARPLGNGFFARPGATEALTITRSPRRISVPVAALIGPQNSSATFQFARAGRESGTVRLYGGTTGGNLRGINGGAFFFVRLPASGLEFDLPLIGYFPTVPQPDAGLAPDVAVAATADDIANGRDPVLNRAVADMLRS